MRVSSGAIDQGNIQKRIREWIEDSPEGQEVRVVELVHDHDKQVVQRWPCGRKTATAQLARQVFDVAVDDANGLGDVQRYILWPYFNGKETPGGRFPFYVIATSAVPDEIDGTPLSEGPTAKGLLSQVMRHQNETMRLMTVVLKQAQDSMLRVNDRQESEIDMLRTENARLGEQMRRNESEAFDRALRWRKALFFEKAKEELLKGIMPFVPMVAGGVLSKFGMNGFANVGALPPAQGGPAKQTGQVNVAGPRSVNGAGGQAQQPQQAASPEPNKPQAPAQSVATMTIEQRLRRLWSTLPQSAKQSFGPVLMGIGIHMLRVVPALKIVEMLEFGQEVRTHPQALSLLEESVKSFLGSFTDDEFKRTLEALVAKGGWLKEQTTILMGVARDLGRNANDFDNELNQEAPRPVAPEPPIRSRVQGEASATQVAQDHAAVHGPPDTGLPKRPIETADTVAGDRQRRQAAVAAAEAVPAPRRRPPARDTRVTIRSSKRK